MKRIIALLLCLVMIFAFAGCKKEKLVPSVLSAQSSPAQDGVTIHLAEAVFDSDKPYLDIEWVNASSKEQTFGLAFNIYRVEEDKKVSCATEELYFHTIAYSIKPLGSHIERYYLNAFDLSKDGTYRFAVEDFPERELWIDFEIKNTAESVSKVGGADSSNVKVTIQ